MTGTLRAKPLFNSAAAWPGRSGEAGIPESPGTGIEWNDEAVERYLAH